MASTTQKKSTSTRSTSGKGGSRSKKPAPPPKQPIRREVGGIVLLGLTLSVLVGYFGVSAIFIDWFAILLKGLFGYGYWLCAPAMLLAAVILLFHRGRPVQLRVTCALLTPVLFGSLVHMGLCQKEYAASFGVLRELWRDGVALESGGAVRYRDIHGELYVGGEGRGWDESKGETDIQIQQTGENAYSVNVTVELLDAAGAENGLECWSFPYTFEGDRWVFSEFQLVN